MSWVFNSLLTTDVFVFQLFVLYGNKAAKSVWGHNIPPAEQIRPDVSPDQRTEFILAKYRKGLYHKAHPLAASQKLLDQVWKWSKHPAIFLVSDLSHVDHCIMFWCSSEVAWGGVWSQCGRDSFSAVFWGKSFVQHHRSRASLRHQRGRELWTGTTDRTTPT